MEATHARTWRPYPNMEYWMYLHPNMVKKGSVRTYSTADPLGSAAWLATTQISTLSFYIARHFSFAYNKATAFIDVKKKTPFLQRSFTTENISRRKQKVQHCYNGPEWRNSGAKVVVQAGYLFLNTLTNKDNLRCRRKQGRGRDEVAENARKNGKEQHHISISSPV